MALNIQARKPKQEEGEEAGEDQSKRSAGTRKSGNGFTKAPAFVRAASQRKRRLIASIAGPEKTGKDHMAFTSNEPGKIYVHSFDIGLEGVIQKFQEEKEIMVAEYELTVQPGSGASDREVGEAANVVWEQFLSNYRDSLSDTAKEGMVVVDTGTEAWELLRLASFGKLTQVMPHHYSKPNAEFRDLLRSGFDATNVVWLHKMKDEWENYTEKGQEKGRRTGRKKFVGMNDVPFLVQVSVETFRNELEGGGSEFRCRVVDCRDNPDINGMELNNDFNELMDMVLVAYE